MTFLKKMRSTTVLTMPRLLPFFFSFFWFLSFCTVYGQGTRDSVIRIGAPEMISSSKKAILSGQVTNPETGELIIGATVYVNNLGMGTATNENGRYALILPVGKHDLTISSVGLEEENRTIELFTDGVLDIGLQERSFSLEEVVVSARPDNQNVIGVKAGAIQLKMDEIRALPSFMGELDVLKSLLSMPGVSTVGEGAGGINVRGGKIDQNLVLFDGAQLFNTSHALGLFSVFNPDVVEKFTLYKGSVPAQYGGRASSVLDVETRTGDFDRIRVMAGLGFITSRLLVEGPVVKGKTSFLAGGRTSYSNWILKSFEKPEIRDSRANFYDLNAMFAHRLNKNNLITLSHYRSHDFFRYSQEYGYIWDTEATTLKWNSILSAGFSTSTTAVIGSYESTLFIPEGVGAYNFKNGQQYTQLKQNFVWNAGDKHLVHFGAELVNYKNRPDDIKPRGDDSGVVSRKVLRDAGREMALYLNDEFELSPRLALSAGLRFSFFQTLGPDTLFLYREGAPLTVANMIDTVSFPKGKVIKNWSGFEPRLSLRYRIGENGSFKVSYNRMRQYVHLISNTTASTPVDIWQLSGRYIPPQISDNYSLGFFRNFSDNALESSVEVFYRQVQNQVDYKDFAQLLLNEHLETDLLFGRGKAYGAEFLVKKNDGRLTGWLSYTYTRSLIRISGQDRETTINEGKWYPSNYDKPHDITLSAKLQHGKNVFWGFNFTYNTGRPITAIVASYEVNQSTVPHFSERNAYRIPDYYRLDFSLTINGKKLVDRRYRGSFTLSIYNLLARDNAFSVYYQQVPKILIPVPVKLSVIGAMIPAISYNFSF